MPEDCNFDTTQERPIDFFYAAPSSRYNGILTLMLLITRRDMTKNQLEIDGILIEILRKPIKNMHLRIYPPDGKVIISAPLKLRLDLIRSQVEARRDWIHTQRARLRARPIIAPTTLESGELHYFLGKSYSLTVHQSTSFMNIIIDKESMHCFIKPNTTLIEKQILLQNWYKQQMKEQLPTLIAKWEPIINVKISAWGIRVMKTRWGSCNTSKGRISLNLNLIKKPLACLEYVLVHEMVHLLEASHNKRFYAFMDQFLPHWRDTQKQLEAKID